MEQVTLNNLDDLIAKYIESRGGESNENTDSEAMFIAIGKYCGAFILSTGLGPVWIGMQNATARMTNGGKPFKSVREALVAVLTSRRPTLLGIKVIYSNNSVERLNWMADRIMENKGSGDYLIYV